MKAKTIIEKLKTCDPEKDVKFGYIYDAMEQIHSDIAGIIEDENEIILGDEGYIEELKRYP